VSEGRPVVAAAVRPWVRRARTAADSSATSDWADASAEPPGDARGFGGTTRVVFLAPGLRLGCVKAAALGLPEVIGKEVGASQPLLSEPLLAEPSPPSLRCACISSKNCKSSARTGARGSHCPAAVRGSSCSGARGNTGVRIARGSCGACGDGGLGSVAAAGAPVDAGCTSAAAADALGELVGSTRPDAPVGPRALP
jgi:hypothetical protein